MKDEVKSDIKDGVAVLEKKEDAPVVTTEPSISDAELDSKIDSALNEDVKIV